MSLRLVDVVELASSTTSVGLGDVPESVPAAIAVDLTASSVALDETKLYNMDGLAPAETKVGRQVRQKS
jgi:hypothetical protein